MAQSCYVHSEQGTRTGLGTTPGTTRLVSPRWEKLSLVWRQDKEWWREETGSLHLYKDKWYPGIVRFEQWRKAITWGRGIKQEWRVCHQSDSFPRGLRCLWMRSPFAIILIFFFFIDFLKKPEENSQDSLGWDLKLDVSTNSKQPYHRVWSRTRSQGPYVLCPVGTKSRLACRFNAFIFRVGDNLCPCRTCRWIACHMLLFLRWPELMQLFWFVGLAVSFLTLRPWAQTQLQPPSQAKHGMGLVWACGQVNSSTGSFSNSSRSKKKLAGCLRGLDDITDIKHFVNSKGSSIWLLLSQMWI